MYRILVALDGSECSLRAARYAAGRSEKAACRIDLLHVEKPVMAWEVGAVSSTDVVLEGRKADSEAVLEAAARQFKHDTEVARHTVTGDPATAILDQASRLGVDEIVIGSRGLRPLGAAMLGSVAYAVVHHAKVPVVIVR
jgi:nucleotide-binding universal stress UspA family protein